MTTRGNATGRPRDPSTGSGPASTRSLTLTSERATGLGAPVSGSRAGGPAVSGSTTSNHAARGSATGAPATGASTTTGASARRACPACGRALAANPDGSWPPHLDAASTALCPGRARRPRRGSPRDEAAPSGTADPDARAETPRRRGDDGRGEERPTYLERREARFRERAILDLDDGPAGEDLDDTLYRARESRGGLPTLGSRRR